MVTKYIVWYEDVFGNRFNEKYLNDFKQALYTFLYLGKKHKNVHLVKVFADDEERISED